VRYSYFWIIVIVIVAFLPACKPKVQEIEEPFTDHFDRGELGADWHDTGSNARLTDGKLNLSKAYNHPVWLRRKLPRDVQIDFEVTSHSPSGDIKVEIFGDGQSFDNDKGRYDPTGYMIVFGGWNNRKSIIGRLGEHDSAVKAQRDRQGDEPLVIPGKKYHFTIIRKSGLIDWKIDGATYLSWNDPDPLDGPGHEFFAINDWESEVVFDNLSIRKVP
jgi:hypothetical protein